VSKAIALVQSFNRGVISPLALARTDLPRTALSAETQTNWMPRVLGSMMLRPGSKYVASSRNDGAAVHIPFVFALDDQAIIELTTGAMRVYVNDAVITRPTVTTAITNGTFTTDLTGWTDVDESGATSEWYSDMLSLVGTRYAAAIRRQTVPVSGGNSGIEHALAIDINQGPVTLMVGSAAGSDNYIARTVLGTGYHSLAFTPTGDFVIEFSSNVQYRALVNSCTIEAAGAMVLTAPWVTADLENVRYDQSADVVYCACDGYQQQKIERRGARSWSVVDYLAEDGPFRTVNLTTTSITPSATTGNITLTASTPIFKSTNVGSLFRLSSIGQYVALSATAAGQWSNPIRVTGVGTNRDISVARSGTWSATVTVQRSVGEVGAWVDVTSYTTNATVTYNDALDNQIIWYRIGIDTGDYTSGTAELSLTYSTGSIDGVVQVTGVASSTIASAIVLKTLGGSSATAIWSEGAWSDRRGFPTSCTLYEGRAIFAGRDKVYASVVDAYESFDDTVDGDSGTISRSIGRGPIDVINWMLPLNSLAIGGQDSEYIVKATTFDEPLTPTNFNIKNPSSQGSSNVQAVKVDSRGIFVNRGATKVFELAYDLNSDSYTSTDLTTLCPEITGDGITKIVVQRNPDTRIHCVRTDGKVAILVYDPAEETRAWVLYETDGTVEDVVVLPAVAEEDGVYYLVNRTINGSTKRYLEKWALESECQGGTLNKQADCFLLYSGASTTTITGLSHLEGESVVVWGGGADLGTYTVSGGQITGLTTAVTSAVIGLPYTAQYKSTKLAYGGSGVASLTQRKRVDHVGMVLYNTHKNGVTYGPDFSNLDSLPDIEDGTTVATGTIHSTYDEDSVEFNGTYDTDSRVCIQAVAPRPATVLALVITMQTSEKI